MESWLHVDMDQPVSLLDVVLRMFLASALGAVVGFEREVKSKAAGLRTHAMVSLGSAVFTLAALEMYQLTLADSATKGDPTRIIEGIVGGIGFLGAGQIIQSRGSVHGVTTAAGVWVVGAVGVACGGGYYALAGLTVGFALLIMAGLAVFEPNGGKQA
ncbi:MAG: MgtC/SapB family protein [Candidatus Binatia bacterium]